MSERIAFITLGCKANHFDTFSLMDQLRERYEVVEGGERADYYVINTCSVTHRADAEARKLIRKMKRLSPGARIIVTGCYAQTAPEVIAKLSEVDLVVGNSHKDKIPELLEELRVQEPAQTPRVYVAPLTSRTAQMPQLPLLRNYQNGTRAFLKIQEGCDYACTFCLTTWARGRLRSLPLQELILELQRFEEQGFKEVVLTGIQIGGYGKDLDPPLSLAQALARMLQETSLPRLRLTSIDPREVDEELLELMAQNPRLCPHLHIPAQSGSTRILRRMARGYTRAKLVALYRKVREYLPSCLIGSDILVGFPGEGVEDFDATLSLIEEWIDHVHPFPYSDRPGTRAATFSPKIPPETIEKRMEVVRALGEKKRDAFARSLHRTVQRVLVETKEEKGRFFGYTDHYIPVRVEGAAPGTLGSFLVEYKDGGLVGRPAPHM